MKELNKFVGSRIKEAREAAGFTQSDLADALGVSSPLVTKMERGQSSITIKNLFELPRILHKPIEYFLGLDKELSDDEAEWLTIYRSLSDIEKQHSLGLMRMWLRERPEGLGE